MTHTRNTDISLCDLLQITNFRIIRSMNRKLIVSMIMLLFSLISELLLWNQAILLSILFILLAFIKHRIYPIKKELAWYLMICVGGALIEIVLVNFGHGWSYSNPSFLGIPVWIPFFWGFVGTTIIVIYDGLTNK